jgi:NAD(P)-dependent dehydrogenase (short-subunit alcohol dehydrogenase family)
MTGAYNASKFALEAIADVLRMELRPWGIDVVLVEPAQTATDMWGTAHDVLDETVAGMSSEHRSLYAKHTAGMRRVIKVSQKMAVPPENVAATIERALTATRPRARYVVGAGPRVQAALSKVTPTPVMDAFLRLATGTPRKP